MINHKNDNDSFNDHVALIRSRMILVFKRWNDIANIAPT